MTPQAGSGVSLIKKNLFLLFVSVIIWMFAIEAVYRVFDPFPYVSNEEMNHTEHGNLSMHDSKLGWKGVPGGKSIFATPNNKVSISHNSVGFRDLEHEGVTNDRPVLVFLGDSYTWGYEVEFREMFVNLLRDKFPGYEVFNLSHRGYGTDQELLTFIDWHNSGPLKLVVLMFSPNDVADNNSSYRYSKPKPQYKILGNRLVLTGVPVPDIKAWSLLSNKKRKHDPWFKKTILSSHFFHDIYFRVERLIIQSNKRAPKPNNTPVDLAVTSRLLRQMRYEVEAKGGQLFVVFIPAKSEIDQAKGSIPYQRAIQDLCQTLGIDSFDLADGFKASWFRTYFRQGLHWTPYGHQVAAELIYPRLEKKLLLGQARAAKDTGKTVGSSL